MAWWRYWEVEMTVEMEEEVEVGGSQSKPEQAAKATQAVCSFVHISPQNPWDPSPSVALLH